jgi:hypothetical protein
MMSYLKQLNRKMKERRIERQNLIAVQELEPRILRDIGVSMDHATRLSRTMY